MVSSTKIAQLNELFDKIIDQILLTIQPNVDLFLYKSTSL